jgi:hypothetical protein
MFDELKPVGPAEDRKRDGRGHYAGWNLTVISKMGLTIMARNRTFKAVLEAMAIKVISIVLLNGGTPTVAALAPMLTVEEADEVCKLFPADAVAIRDARK